MAMITWVPDRSVKALIATPPLFALLSSCKPKGTYKGLEVKPC